VGVEVSEELESDGLTAQEWILRDNLSPPKRMVLDGGLATELERRGCDLSGSLWSARALIDFPDVIEAVHLDYLSAGADCIVTASYQVSFEGFAAAGFSTGDTVTALEKSVTVAESARARFCKASTRRPWIAASVGPYGAMLHDGSEYHGKYGCSFSELVAFHRSRLRVLATTNADLLACETIPSLDEAMALVEALREFPQLKVWISFTCRDGFDTAHGERLSECAQALDREPQVVALGVNCTPPHYISSLIREARQSTRKPLVIYPNSGKTWNAVERRWMGNSEFCDFGVMAREWYSEGANWIGGCCGTEPADIRRIREVLVDVEP
jgi:homocysteine S-methyltransferase